MNDSRNSSIARFVVMVAIACNAHRVSADEPRVISNSIGMKLAWIPAGTFVMGSPKSEAERHDKEERHPVAIAQSFYLGVYEVTQAEYDEVMQAVENAENRSAFKHDNNPVENVEWKKAQLFCQQLTARPDEIAAGRSYRLPTESEWEYACRAGSTSTFHTGDSLSSHEANFCGNYPGGGAEQGPYLRKTTNVGTYQPNRWGLYDMHGNVAEWCADWYDPEYYWDSPEQDPLGPPFGVIPTGFTNNGNQNFYVVVRGGCWADDGRACRSAYRFRAMPNTQYRLIGFRVACDVKAELK